MEAPPNLNASDEPPVDELPNLNSAEGADGSEEELPNLKDAVEVESEKVPPNFSSSEAGFEELEVPNLNALEHDIVLDD